MRLILLEDDPPQAQLLSLWLEELDIAYVHADSLHSFGKLVRQQPVDLAILDWELPDGTGLQALRILELNQRSPCPVIFVTQRDSEQDIVTALESGADDYLVKPVRKQEFTARLYALARRSGLLASQSIIALGPFRIDTRSEQVSVGEEAVKLTGKDYQLACCLLSNPGKLLSREYLLKTVWGIDADINTRTVDVHVSRLRRKLSLGPQSGYYLKNIYQHGYRLEAIHG